MLAYDSNYKIYVPKRHNVYGLYGCVARFPCGDANGDALVDSLKEIHGWLK